MIHDRMQLGKYIIGKVSFDDKEQRYYRADFFSFQNENNRYEYKVLVMDKLDFSDLATLSSDGILKSNITYSMKCPACSFSQPHSIKYHQSMLNKDSQNFV